MSKNRINLAKRLNAYRKSEQINQSELALRLGVSRNYVSMLEGDKLVDEDCSLVLLFSVLEANVDGPPLSCLNESNAVYVSKPNPARMIRIISWAHAGEALDYEELPDSWQKEVPTMCRDEKAFGLTLEGDSMTPRFHEGAELVVSPSSEPYSGQYVVVKFVDQRGVLFRRLEVEKTVFRLVPENDRYPVREYQAADFEWIYPIHGVFETLMK